MKDYESKTIEKIRVMSPIVGILSDSAISHLYREWSESHWCAGWIDGNEYNCQSFIDWATKRPIDRDDLE